VREGGRGGRGGVQTLRAVAGIRLGPIGLIHGRAAPPPNLDLILN